jgi:hypothetical protein
VFLFLPSFSLVCALASSPSLGTRVRNVLRHPRSLALSVLLSLPSVILDDPSILATVTSATSVLNEWVSSLSFKLLARRCRVHTQEKGDPLWRRSAPGPHRGLEERHEYGSHRVSMRLLELTRKNAAYSFAPNRTLAVRSCTCAFCRACAT